MHSVCIQEQNVQNTSQGELYKEYLLVAVTDQFNDGSIRCIYMKVYKHEYSQNVPNGLNVSEKSLIIIVQKYKWVMPCILYLLAVAELYNSDEARTRSVVWLNVKKHKQHGLYEVSERKQF